MADTDDTVTTESELLKVITPREVREIYVNLAEINIKLNGIRTLGKKMDELATNTRGRFEEIDKRLTVLENKNLQTASKWDFARVTLDCLFAIGLVLIGTEAFWNWTR